jgi:hypothetical protein
LNNSNKIAIRPRGGIWARWRCRRSVAQVSRRRGRLLFATVEEQRTGIESGSCSSIGCQWSLLGPGPSWNRDGNWNTGQLGCSFPPSKEWSGSHCDTHHKPLLIGHHPVRPVSTPYGVASMLPATRQMSKLGISAVDGVNVIVTWGLRDKVGGLEEVQATQSPGAWYPFDLRTGALNCSMAIPLHRSRLPVCMHACMYKCQCRSWVLANQLQQGSSNLVRAGCVEEVAAVLDHGQGGVLGRSEQLDLLRGDLRAVWRVCGSLQSETPTISQRIHTGKRHRLSRT